MRWVESAGFWILPVGLLLNAKHKCCLMSVAPYHRQPSTTFSMWHSTKVPLDVLQRQLRHRTTGNRHSTTVPLKVLQCPLWHCTTGNHQRHSTFSHSPTGSTSTPSVAPYYRQSSTIFNIWRSTTASPKVLEHHRMDYIFTLKLFVEIVDQS